MEQLEMVKAFAKLEGFDIYIVKDGVVYDVSMIEYNPITDLALNCAARDKYSVDIEYFRNNVALRIYNVDDECDYDVNIDAVNIADEVDKSLIPLAVIECILKSKRLWV